MSKKTVGKVIVKKVISAKKIVATVSSKKITKKKAIKAVVNPYLIGAAAKKEGKKIVAKNYDIFVVPADQEKELADLRNTGKSLGEISINTESADDKVNEVLIVLKK